MRFSATWFGFDPDSARRHSDATVILRNPDGVDVALHRDPAPEQPAFVHVGFQLLEAEAVYVAFTCLEPDGWQVEVCWEPTGDASL